MTAFFSELFRIEPSELESLLDPDLERTESNSLWLRSLGDLELVGLWESLPHSQAGDSLMGELLAEDGALILSVPEDFLKALAQLNETHMETVSQKWQQSEEMAHWSIAELTDVLKRLHSFVCQAQASGQIIVQLAEF